MQDLDLLFAMLVAFAWVIVQVIRRVLKRPRPLGTIVDAKEAPPVPPVARYESPRFPPVAHEAPESLDAGWGREVPVPATPSPSLPPVRPAGARADPTPRRPEPFQWSTGEVHDEVAAALVMARRQAQARQALVDGGSRGRHPHWPRLRTPADLRSAVVIAAVLGPCRAMEPYEAPGGPS